MRLIAGAINNDWLQKILHDCEEDCEWVKAAVAYAKGNPSLINFCFEKNIPLAFWGRYDYSVPVAVHILKKFLTRRSPDFVCKLLPEIFHPKVIWWGGYGAYIGSANLTDSAWGGNIECGVFLFENELVEQGLDLALQHFFDTVDLHSSPLTEEVLNELMETEQKNRNIERSMKNDFDQKRSIPRKNLASVDKVSSELKSKQAFLDEWKSTLQILRDIGERVSTEEYRPVWIGSEIPKGVQADQFLHAYYYSNVRDGNISRHKELYEKNMNNAEAALVAAFSWWHNLQTPPHQENRTIYEWAPVLRDYLSSGKLLKLSSAEFRKVCGYIHAVRDHSLRVTNETYGLPKTVPQKQQEECLDLLAEYLLKQKSEAGKNVKEVIYHVLYGGASNDVPLRLWEATQTMPWRIPHLGISTLGEMVGWALPNDFPPRNGRSSKCLRALGYTVRIHTE